MPGAPLELIAVEVRADLDQLQIKMAGAARTVDQSMDSVGQSIAQAERQTVRSSAVIGQSFNSAAQRSRLLGYQISDIGTQLSMGSSPFLILAQQAPQVANALEGTTGVAGRMAAFFSGPWGAALLAAASVAGVLIGKLWETDEALEEVKSTAEEAAESMTKVWQELGRTNAVTDAATKNVKSWAEASSGLAKTNRELQQAIRLRDSLARTPGGVQGLEVQNARVADLEAQRARFQQQQSDARRSLDDLRAAANVQRIQQQNEARADGSGRAKGSNRRTSSGADRAALQAQREAEQLERQYETTLRRMRLEEQLAALRDQGTDAARMQADLMEANFRLEEQFPALDRDRLQILKEIAAATIEEAYGRKAAKEALDAWFEEAEKRQKEQAEERKKLEEMAAREQEQRIRTLGQLYYDAFNGGTEAIWDNFKQIGLAVIAEVLARFTLAKMGGGSFDLGSAIGAAVSAVLPGFASGGTMRLGGRGGVDRNVLALNGRPIARVSAGEELSVRNPALGSAGRAPPVVNQSFHVDARGAWLADDFGRMLLDQARRQAMVMDAKVSHQTLKAAPGYLQNHQRYARR